MYRKNLHESNITYKVGEILKTFFGEDRIIFEGIVESRERVDIVLDNYQLLVEVEPNKNRVFTKDSGLNQLENYAKKILHITNHEEIFGIVAYEEKQELRFIPVYYKKNSNPIIEKELNITEFENYILRIKEKILTKKLDFNIQTFFHVFNLVIHGYLDKIVKIIKNKKTKDDFNVLYNAYVNALKIIYGKDELAEDKLNKLFSIHTLLQAIAIGILSELYNLKDRGIRFISTEGKPFAVGLPFLDWFNRISLTEDEKKFFDELSEFIRAQVKRFNYDSNWTIDVFRLLYEQFIDQEDRWTFGEYYTPLYLVNIVLDLVGRDKVSKHIVLDPFCGSGTFLYACFKEKVNSGKDPKIAMSELIGFDINPLAVSLARAELLIAYLIEARQTNQKPENIIPAIYYLNSSDVFSSTQGILFTFVKKGKKELDSIPVFLYDVKDLLYLVNITEVSKIKNLLTLQEIEYELKGLIKSFVNNNPNKEIEKKKKKFIEKYGNIINFEKLEKFINKHGNGVWSVSIVSLIARNIVFNTLKEQVIVLSNPPWKSLGEISGKYGEALKNITKEKKLHEYKGRRLAEAINRGDVSSLFLYGFQNIKPIDIAFIMPETVAYDEKLSGVGKILTFNALKGKADIYKISYNVFEHGIYPAIVKQGEGNIYKIQITEKKVHKFMNKVDYQIKKLNLNFKKHVDDVYFVFGISNENISKFLKVNKFLGGWSSITGLRGLFAEKNKAGLFICDKIKGCPSTFKLHGLNYYIDIQEVDVDLDKDIKQLVYYSLVFPFAIFTIDILMPDKISKLENILSKIELKLQDPNEKIMIKNLLKETKKIKQDPTVSNPNMWYVVYKDSRTFLSGVIRGNFLLHQTCIFIECSDDLAAYYYASALNWLALQVKNGYLRSNKRRPICSLIKLNLCYKNEEWQRYVAEKGKVIEKKAKEFFIKKFEEWKNSKCEGYKITIKSQESLNWLSSLSEWKIIENEFNQRITPELLDDALKLVKDRI
ncbi:MAG: hypothetical protein QXM53_07470 [Thermofilaceae archaeon]